MKFNPKLRIAKNARVDIETMLAEQGFIHIDTTADRVTIWSSNHRDKTWLGDFVWQKDLRSWVFNSRRAVVRTYVDVETAIQEFQTDLKAIDDLEDPWERFKTSKTNKNWQRYRGFVAALWRLFPSVGA